MVHSSITQPQTALLERDILLSDGTIYLRRLEASDLARTHQWIHREELFKTVGSFGPVSSTTQTRWFESIDQSSSKLIFAVCTARDDSHIGNVSLDSIDYRHRHARLAIFIAEAKSRRSGKGGRAMTLILEYAFNYLNLQRIHLKMDADNTDALRFYERFGFVSEGCLRRHEFREGQYIDKLVLGLLRDDYGAAR